MLKSVTKYSPKVLQLSHIMVPKFEAITDYE